jgi:hypothetical protein
MAETRAQGDPPDRERSGLVVIERLRWQVTCMICGDCDQFQHRATASWWAFAHNRRRRKWECGELAPGAGASSC